MNPRELLGTWNLLHLGPDVGEGRNAFAEVAERLMKSSGDPKALKRWLAVERDDYQLFASFFGRPPSPVSTRPVLLPRDIPRANQWQGMDLCMWQQCTLRSLKL